MEQLPHRALVCLGVEGTLGHGDAIHCLAQLLLLVLGTTSAQCYSPSHCSDMALIASSCREKKTTDMLLARGIGHCPLGKGWGLVRVGVWRGLSDGFEDLEC